MHTDERIRLARPEFAPDEIAAVDAVLRSGMLIQGEQVERFEKAVATYLGVQEAVANANGTVAIYMALAALGVGPGDEVIVPDYTFMATANMIEALGATPVMADIDLATFNLDPDRVASHITDRTKAIMPVHLFGLMADLGAILPIAEAAGIPVIEDAACAIGASYPSVGAAGIETTHTVGSQSTIATLSFHPRKVITTGEGGMVVTNDDRLAREMRRFRNHGANWIGGRMICSDYGFNFRLTEMQGALGNAQMSRLDQYILRRRETAALYDHRLSGLPLATPYVPSGFSHIYQAYVVMVPESISRDDIIRQLAEVNIESNIGTYSMHLQPYFREKYDLKPGQFPNSHAAFHRTLALPLHPQITDADVERVVGALARILEGMRP